MQRLSAKNTADLVRKVFWRRWRSIFARDGRFVLASGTRSQMTINGTAQIHSGALSYFPAQK
jgi:hypothetical protein